MVTSMATRFMGLAASALEPVKAVKMLMVLNVLRGLMVLMVPISA